ncbi:MAG: hypothetical protein KTR21_10405 [Rhodobacteraceae bacterium]|nr:hypothetical protein [Paracoccaceae bacterium]
METPDLIAFASAGVAVLSLIANGMVVRRQLRLQTEEIRAAIDAETSRWCADVLQAFEAASTRLDEIAAGHAASASGARTAALAERFSTLADIGRLYFPNFEPESRGGEKPAAFRGDRQPAIDAVLFAYDVACNLDALTPEQAREALKLLFDTRRLLISEVLIARDPRRLEVLNPKAEKTYREAVKDETRQIWPLVRRLEEIGVTPRAFNEHASSRVKRA